VSTARLIATRLATWLGHWPVALAACAVLAAAMLLPGLDGPGLWEPQERQLSDRVAPLSHPPPGPPGASDKAPRPPPPPPARDLKDSCVRTAPPDAMARSLTARAIPWGRDAIGDSDGGRRLPLALLGVLTVLAAAGTALRLAGTRAALVTAVVLLAMPLCALQARMLTSEIGTACGASLLVYGLVALGDLRGSLARVAIDAVVAVLAVAAGAVLGFTGGGALLGLVAPIGAIAVAGGLGLSRLVRRRDPATPWGTALVAALAGLAALALIGLLFHQLYDLKTPYPGMTPPAARALLGKAIVPTGCYSWALGGIWRPEDDLRITFDSTFEQIAYGTYPWGLLAPIAMAALLAAADPRRRRLGAVTLAWAGAAWVASEAFQRKVGFTVYAGFPAMAIAVGTWLDAMLAGRARGEPGAVPPGARLIALFAVLGALELGKDLQSFSERLTSLLVGNDAVPYPAQAHLAWVPPRLWVLVLGMVIAAGFALAIAVAPAGDAPRDRWLRRLATRGAFTAIGATFVLAAFWTALWQPVLATHLSSKGMFDTYQELARPGDALVVMGDLGQAPFAYTRQPPEIVPDRAQILAALARPGRVFAIAPQSELCTLHREIAGKPYFVLDDRNLRNLLLSNRVDGAIDRNPLRTAIVHEEPKDIPHRPKGRVVWDNRIQLLGWDVPRSVARGARFDVTLYYKILQPVGGTWKTLFHVDGAGVRAGIGDHDPINGRCPTSTWQLGDYIIDRFTTSAGGGAFPSGVYEIWTGFFTGANPNWRNMTLSEAPGDIRDSVDRVKIATIGLE
jgi:hypothetical protein